MRALIHRYWELRRSRRWVRWAEDAVFALAIFAAVLSWQTRNLVDSGETAPSFTLTDTRGRTWTLEGLRGKQVLLHFWAPWCGVCAVETGTISRVHRAAADDLVVLSVATAYEDPAEVTAFMARHGVDYPVLLGGDPASRAYRVNAFPTTYVISKEGRIQGAAVGYTTRFGLWLRRQVWAFW